MDNDRIHDECRSPTFQDIITLNTLHNRPNRFWVLSTTLESGKKKNSTSITSICEGLNAESIVFNIPDNIPRQYLLTQCTHMAKRTPLNPAYSQTAQWLTENERITKLTH